MYYLSYKTKCLTRNFSVDNNTYRGGVGKRKSPKNRNAKAKSGKFVFKNGNDFREYT